MIEARTKRLVEFVKLAVIDIEDQVVVYVDPSPPPGKQLIKTKNKTGTPVVYHFLWRPSSDMQFRVNDEILHHIDPLLHKDDANQAPGTGGQLYDALTAPFIHTTIES